jgi:hypothetical protein
MGISTVCAFPMGLRRLEPLKQFVVFGVFYVRSPALPSRYNHLSLLILTSAFRFVALCGCGRPC